MLITVDQGSQRQDHPGNKHVLAATKSVWNPVGDPGRDRSMQTKTALKTIKY